MEKVRMEIEESRKRHSRRVIEAVEVGMIKRLKAKEEEIEKIGKLNWALEERVKSLYIENQIWRDLFSRTKPQPTRYEATSRWFWGKFRTCTPPPTPPEPTSPNWWWFLTSPPLPCFD